MRQERRDKRDGGRQEGRGEAGSSRVAAAGGKYCTASNVSLVTWGGAGRGARQLLFNIGGVGSEGRRD